MLRRTFLGAVAASAVLASSAASAALVTTPAGFGLGCQKVGIDSVFRCRDFIPVP